MNELLARADGFTVFILIIAALYTLEQCVEAIAKAFKKPDIHKHYTCQHKDCHDTDSST